MPPPRASCLINPSTTRLQVVQRSLSGGFLTDDAALLNANARSMLDEARRDPPEPYGAGRPELVPSHPEAGYRLWEVLRHTALTFT